MEGVGLGRAQASESPGLGVAPYQAPLTDYPVLLEKLQEKWEEVAEKQKGREEEKETGDRILGPAGLGPGILGCILSP